MQSVVVNFKDQKSHLVADDSESVCTGTELRTGTEPICYFCPKVGAIRAPYTCPRCNQPYCSVACYKSAAHLRCSEDFYRRQVLAELALNDTYAAQSPHRLADQTHVARLLRADWQSKQHLVDAQLDPCCSESQSDLSRRLQDTNLNNPDDIWQALTEEERRQFRELVAASDASARLGITSWCPWWKRLLDEVPKKVIEVRDRQDAALQPISAGVTLPASCASKWNLPLLALSQLDLLLTYTLLCSYYNGDYKAMATEFCDYFCFYSSSLSGTFSSCHFECVEQVVATLTTRLTESKSKTLGNSNCSLLVQLLESISYCSKLLADAHENRLKRPKAIVTLCFEDLISVFEAAKKQLRRATVAASDEAGQVGGTGDPLARKPHSSATFSRCSGGPAAPAAPALAAKQLTTCIKKLQFFAQLSQLPDMWLIGFEQLLPQLHVAYSCRADLLPSEHRQALTTAELPARSECSAVDALHPHQPPQLLIEEL